MNIRIPRLATAFGLLAALPLSAQPFSSIPTQSLESLLRVLSRQGSDVAIVSYTVGPNGEPDAADPAIFHRADEPHLLASSSKILLLGAYALEVSRGHLSPAEPISLAEWERFQVPFTDGGAHPAALEELGIAHDEFGLATDPATRVPLDTIVAAMIVHSDNAAIDLLLDKVGRGPLLEARQLLGLEHHDLQRSFAGTLLLALHPEDPGLTPARLAELRALPREAIDAEVARYRQLYQQPAFHSQVLALLGSGEAPDPALLREAWEILMPKSTAREIAQVLAKVATGRAISPEVSALMARHLEWASVLPPIAEAFERFGNKGGDLEGVLNMAAYGVPRVGELQGKLRVSVVFLQNLDEPLRQQLLEGEDWPALWLAPLWVRQAGELLGAGLCLEDGVSLCLGHGRFRARIHYQTPAGVAGAGRAAPARSDDSGLFSFFSENNWEMLVKVLDGCAINGHTWVFAAGATDVGFELDVEDLTTGARWSAASAAGAPATAITATDALACP